MLSSHPTAVNDSTSQDNYKQLLFGFHPPVTHLVRSGVWTNMEFKVLVLRSSAGADPCGQPQAKPRAIYHKFWNYGSLTQYKPGDFLRNTNILQTIGDSVKYQIKWSQTFTCIGVNIGQRNKKPLFCAVFIGHVSHLDFLIF